MRMEDAWDEIEMQCSLVTYREYPTRDLIYNTLKSPVTPGINHAMLRENITQLVYNEGKPSKT